MQTNTAEALGAARLSRREAIRTFGLGVGAVALAACTRPTDTTSSPSSNVIEDPSTWWAQQQTTGLVDFANWPYYIDRTREGTHPSLQLFTKRTDVQVNYTRPIRENARFLDRIRPTLQAGEPEYDLIVISNGPELSELMASKWLTPLDHERLPHFAEFAAPLARGPVWDPENRYTVAWQSGFTGLGFRPEAVEALGREPRSVNDLWDPALRSRVGMMTDLLDLGSAGLLATGVDPATSTSADWRLASDLLREQRQTVSPRYYDQGYIDALGRGDTWISLAWSGDVFQLQQLGHPEVRWVMPDEGAMFWTDNLMIPRGAKHPADAIALMDFVYRPKVAALIADWVWYVSPVPAARSVIAKRLDDKAVANSPLVFPDFPDTSETAAGGSVQGGPVRNYYVFSDSQEYSMWRSTFEPVIYGN